MRYCTIIIVAWGVKIGKDCLLCSSPMTREPYLINIGNNVIIAAGLVVNKDISDYTLVAGISAKKFRELAKIKIL